MCFIAYIHPAKNHPKRVSNYKKHKLITEMSLTDTTPSYNYNQLKKIRDMNKNIIKIYVYNLKENKAIIPVLNTHNNPEVC